MFKCQPLWGSCQMIEYIKGFSLSAQEQYLQCILKEANVPLSQVKERYFANNNSSHLLYHTQKPEPSSVSELVLKRFLRNFFGVSMFSMLPTTVDGSLSRLLHHVTMLA